MYLLINKELLMYRELDGSKAVGIDEVTKKEYGENLEQNIKGLVERLNFTKICYIVDADIKVITS